MIENDYASKSIQAKQRAVAEQRFMGRPSKGDSSGRLPPGQSLVKGLPVLDLGVQPEIELANWRLTIDGLVKTPVVIDWAQFNTLEQYSATVDIHCVTAWSSFDNQWSGVSTVQLAELVTPLPGATHVLLHATDGYTTNVPVDDFLATGCLVATAWNNDLLSTSHGGPARAVIPHLYFWKSAKWITRIEFIDADRPGYWEQRGYHNDGDPWQEQRYGIPAVREPAPVVTPPPLTEQIAAPKPSLITRAIGWVRYHFFPTS
jgi:DMSO/TMAO reductase YedYZ molybdopterin-dependent catalytic subunit